ncbi:hypothetical protein MRX96_028072 [Rhipicephalus microplus]
MFSLISRPSLPHLPVLFPEPRLRTRWRSWTHASAKPCDHLTFPLAWPSGLRVCECLPVLDPPTAVSFDGRINWQLYKELDLRPPLWWAWDFGKDVHASGTLLLCCADLDRRCLIYQSFSRSRVCAPGSVPGHALQSNHAIT